MGMPPWAMIAGGLLGVDKLVLEPGANIYKTVQGIRQDMRDSEDSKTFNDYIARYGKARTPEEINAIRQSDYAVNSPENRMKIQKYGDDLLSSAQKQAEEQQVVSDMSQFGAAVQQSGQDLPTYVANNIDKVPWKSLEKFDKAYGNVRQSVNDAIDLKSRQEYLKANQQSTALLQPNQGKYRTAPEIRAGVGDALSQYQYLKPDQVNSINQNVDKGLSDVWTPTIERKAGKNYVVGNENPYTGEKKEKSVGSDFKVTVNGGGGSGGSSGGSKRDKVANANFMKAVNKMNGIWTKEGDSDNYRRSRRIVQNIVNAAERSGINLDYEMSGLEYQSNVPTKTPKATQPQLTPEQAIAELKRRGKL